MGKKPVAYKSHCPICDSNKKNILSSDCLYWLLCVCARARTVVLLLDIDSNQFRFQRVPIETRDPTTCYVVGLLSVRRASVYACVSCTRTSPDYIIVAFHFTLFSYRSHFHHVLFISSFFSCSERARTHTHGAATSFVI